MLLDQIEGLRKDIAQIREEKNFSEPSRYLTREQVCKLAGISLQTLWTKTKAGMFRSYKIGSAVRYLEGNVVDLRIFRAFYMPCNAFLAACASLATFGWV